MTPHRNALCSFTTHPRATRALALILTALGTLTLTAPSAHAQADYPTHSPHIIAGFVPGSSTDLISRLMANHWSKVLGQQFVVENRPGAASAIAARM